MRHNWMAGIAAFALAALCGGCDTQAAEPRRIVSLNLCTDQILMDLVEPARVAAISHLASDPSISAAASEARSFKAIRGSAEEVLALDPDLVIAMEYSTPATVALLQRLGRRVLVVPLATDFEGIRNAIRSIARATGRDARGTALIAEFDHRLQAAIPEAPTRPTALAYQVNNIAAGPSTLLDAIIDKAGLENLARRRNLGVASRLPLESLVGDPPDVVVLANAPDEFRTVVADNLRHPALTLLMSGRAHVAIDMPLWLCGTPRVTEAVDRLASAHRRSLAFKPGTRDVPR